MVDVQNAYKFALSYFPYAPDTKQEQVIKVIIANVLGADYPFTNAKQEQVIVMGSKGISLIGAAGTGKTTIFRSLSKFFSAYGKSLRVVTAVEIVSDVINNSPGILEKYVYGYLCISDIGSENCPANYYGTSINVIKELILLRYDKQSQLPVEQRTKLYLEHNLTTDKLKERYDDIYGRISSRLKEMMQTLSFGNNTKDHRSEK